MNWAVQSGSANKLPPPIMPVTPGFSTASATGDYSVYIGELDPNVTDSILLDAFSSYKSIINANVIVDPITKRSKKYGFVRFSNFEESQRAIYEMNGKYVLGRAIKLNIGFKKSNPPALTSAPTYVPSYGGFPPGPSTGYNYPASSYPSSSYPSSSYPSSSYPTSSYPQPSYPSYGTDPYKSQQPAGAYNYGGAYGYASDPYAQSTQPSQYNYSGGYSYPASSQPTSYPASSQPSAYGGSSHDYSSGHAYSYPPPRYDKQNYLDNIPQPHGSAPASATSYSSPPVGQSQTGYPLQYENYYQSQPVDYQDVQATNEDKGDVDIGLDEDVDMLFTNEEIGQLNQTYFKQLWGTQGKINFKFSINSF